MADDNGTGQLQPEDAAQMIERWRGAGRLILLVDALDQATSIESYEIKSGELRLGKRP